MPLGHSGRRTCFRSIVEQDLQGRLTEWRLESCRGVVSPERACPTRSMAGKNMRPSACKKGKDPLVWIGHVDDVGNMLACLDMHKTEVILRRQIVRNLTSETWNAVCSAYVPQSPPQRSRGKLRRLSRARHSLSFSGVRWRRFGDGA